jgi:glycosyltransferase involved in cell wall biosynthesis
VAWCHDLSWTNPLYQELLYERAPWTLLKTLAPRTTYVVVSEDRRADLARLTGADPGALPVIPAGVDLAETWGLGRATRRLLAEFRLLNADPFILLPVRITRRKNIELAIRVVDELRGLGLRPKLLVTGPRGPHDPASIQYVRELEALIETLALRTVVILLQTRPGPSGRIWRPTDAMMAELYRAADLALLPSAQEGFGIPVVEAGAVNLPIFCSDIPPFREIAAESAHFFSLDDSPRAVAERIAGFLDGDARLVLRRRVRTSYDWDALVDHQLLPLLQNVAAGSPTVDRRDQEPAGIR